LSVIGDAGFLAVAEIFGYVAVAFFTLFMIFESPGLF
jgi:hypothetical protein